MHTNRCLSYIITGQSYTVYSACASVYGCTCTKAHVGIYTLLHAYDLSHHLVAGGSPNKAAPATAHNTVYNNGRFAFMS